MYDALIFWEMKSSTKSVQIPKTLCTLPVKTIVVCTLEKKLLGQGLILCDIAMRQYHKHSQIGDGGCKVQDYVRMILPKPLGLMSCSKCVDRGV